MHYCTNTILDVIHTNRDLVELHWAEVIADQPDATLRISDSKYKWLEDNNHLATYTVHDEDKMVGYAVWTILESLHSGNLQAVNDCIYIHPDYRNKGLASKLMELSELSLTEQGIKHMGISMKSYGRFEGLVKELGYKLTELTYTKSTGG